MRQLRILVEWSRGRLPVVVASAVIPAASCSDDEVTKTTSQAGRGGLTNDASLDTSGAAGSGGASGALGFGGGGGTIDPAGGAAGTGISGCYTYTVGLPPAGIPASLDPDCTLDDKHPSGCQS